MPRRARTWQRALCYHVYNRGVVDRRIFTDASDRARLTRIACDLKDETGAKVYHWAWMDTHYHLLVEIPFARLRAFAGGLQQRYAQYHHRRHGSRGVFWSARYHSKPVELGKDYLLPCGRYIERNPVRAGLVERAWDYPWSSAAFYVLGAMDGLTDRNVSAMGEDPTPDERRYYGNVLTQTTVDTWMAEHDKCAVLGSPSFGARIRALGARHARKRGPPRKQGCV